MNDTNIKKKCVCGALAVTLLSSYPWCGKCDYIPEHEPPAQNYSQTMHALSMMSSASISRSGSMVSASPSPSQSE